MRTHLEIAIEMARQGEVVAIAIEDNGAPFDPRTSAADARIPARGGGAGINLVRSWSKIADYSSGYGRNRLEIRLSLSGV